MTDAGIALFTVDHPPVNALSQATRAALLDTIAAVEADPAVRALIIAGAGRHFVAGADVREFDHEPAAPLLNDVLWRLESLNVPVIAALHGAVLGGGLELALACHFRCATRDTTLGFPEIHLGLLPGAGGTQRMPRLIGVARTVEMMRTGKPIDAAQARAWGIVDREIEGDALDGAYLYARELLHESTPVIRVRDRPVAADAAPVGRKDEPDPGTLRRRNELPAVGFIDECVEASRSLPFAQGVALGRRRFEECRVSPASRALRHLFFAERPRKPAGWPAPRDVTAVAVVGAGTMGSGIALALASAGFAVTLIDPDAAALAAGMGRLRSTLEGSAAKGRLSAAAAAAALARVAASSDLQSAGTTDLVIEAVFESLSVKQEVFRALDALCPTAVLASNTSTLDIDALASVCRRPDAVVGMHFFSPAHVMRLVEIVRGRAASPQALATAASVVRKLGKLGVVVGNGFGFVGNRLLYAYGRENQYLLLEGATPTQIDAALLRFGMAMGPNAVGDLAGLDVGYRVRRERRDRPSDPRYYRVADLLVEGGRLGQKTGRGAFTYAPGSREPTRDPEVDALIAAEAVRLGIARRAIADEEIVERCVLALINEAARLLAEGIAQCAADVDVIWCNGYGFPRATGGPLWYADGLGLRTVLASIERYRETLGAADWTPSPLLAELARTGRSFAAWDQERAAPIDAPGSAT